MMRSRIKKTTTHRLPSSRLWNCWWHMNSKAIEKNKALFWLHSPHQQLQRVVPADLPSCLFTQSKKRNFMFKMKRNMHGLEDADLIWYGLLVARFIHLCFQELNGDPCVLKRSNLIVVLYVDDIIRFGKTYHEIDEIIRTLSKLST